MIKIQGEQQAIFEEGVLDTKNLTEYLSKVSDEFLGA